MASVITPNERQRTKLMAFLRTCKGIYVGNEEKTLGFLEAILWMVRICTPCQVPFHTKCGRTPFAPILQWDIIPSSLSTTRLLLLADQCFGIVQK